jgi:hypothetical protein
MSETHFCPVNEESRPLITGRRNFPKTGLADMSRHICLVENRRRTVPVVTKRIAA